MHQHFENWNDLKHEPQNFWSAETFLNFRQNYSHTRLAMVNHRRLFIDFFWGEGGLDSDKSRYFVIAEFNNNCFIIWSPCISSGSKAICHFHARRKAWFWRVWKEYYLKPNAKAKHSWTTLRMSRPLFVGSYLQVTWWALGQWKGRKICIEW